jgi:hypothetical protein
MVDAIAPVGASSASAPIKTESSLSIAEPDNAWTDARQSQINADLAALKDARQDEKDGRDEEDVPENSLDDRHPHRRQEAATVPAETSDKPSESGKLSGESERIGTRNFDDKTPFGHRELII